MFYFTLPSPAYGSLSARSGKTIVNGKPDYKTSVLHGGAGHHDLFVDIDDWQDGRASDAGPLIHFRDRLSKSVIMRPLLLAVLALSLAVIVLGWIAGLEAVVRGVESSAAMVPSTAFLFALSALALIAPLMVPMANVARLNRAIAVMVILVALTNIIFQNYTRFSGIDQWAFPNHDIFAVETMSPATSLCFVILGGALWRLASTAERDRLFVMLSTCGLALSVFPLIVFSFDAGSLYQAALFANMAVHTAGCFVALFSVILWSRPDRGWVAILSRKESGSAAARRLMPVAVLLPFLLTLFTHWIERAGWLELSFQLSIVAMSGVLLMSFVVLHEAVSRNRMEREYISTVTDLAQSRAMRAAERSSDDNFRHMAETLPVGIIQVDSTGMVVFTNRAMREITGLDLARHQDAPVQQAMEHMRVPEGPELMNEFLSGAGEPELELQMLRDEKEVWVRAFRSEVFDLERRPAGFVYALVNITESRHAIEALREARDKATEAGLAKSAFLANMSHEIRTPMNGVMGFAQLLLESDLNAKQRYQASLIAESGQSMVQILNDILDFSKIEAGLMTLKEAAFDLHGAVESSTRLMRGAAEQKRVNLETHFERDVPKMVIGDDLRLRQILSNLIGNAVKFTNEGAVDVFVSAIEKGDEIVAEIVVEDTGIGIAEDRQEAVFDAFVQSDNSTARKFGGTGLGLAISRRMAESMGGSLSLQSGADVGTSVRLSIPFRLSENKAVQHERRALPRNTEDEKQATQPVSARRILIAEDHDINQMLIVDMIESLGYSCDVAENGKEAIAMLEEASANRNPYDIVLMDIQMPVMDGLEATACIRKKGFAPENLPIVAVTANAYENDIRDCLNAGMQAHLGKPIRSAALAQMLSRWLPKQHEAA